MANRLRLTWLAALLVVSLAALATDAAAQGAATAAKGADAVAPAPDAETKDFWSRDQILGDWGGVRKDLADLGISIELRLTQIYQGVSSGGVDTNTEYGGVADYILNVDAHKLGLWEGFGLNLHATTRFGSDILADAGAFALPNSPMLYPSPGDYHGTFITGLLATQMLFDNKAQVLVGKLHALDVLNGMFPHIVDSGQDGFLNANSMLAILPWARWLTFSMYGVAGWTIEDKMASTGFMLVGTENVAASWGSWNESFSKGVSILLFHRILFEVDSKPGYVYIGGGGSTRRYGSTDKSDWIVIPDEGVKDTKKKRPYTLAAYWYQVIDQNQQDEKRFTQFLVGASIGDDNPSFSNWDVFGSIQSFGPFDFRPNDRAGFAAWYNHLANDFVNTVSTVPGIDLSNNTWGFELYYNIEITPWLHLTPDIQLVQNQNKHDSIAVIPGIRLVMDF